jgi:hypothetical protein
MNHFNNLLIDRFPDAVVVRFSSWRKPTTLEPFNNKAWTVSHLEEQQTPSGALKWDDLS